MNGAGAAAICLCVENKVGFRTADAGEAGALFHLRAVMVGEEFDGTGFDGDGASAAIPRTAARFDLQAVRFREVE